MKKIFVSVLVIFILYTISVSISIGQTYPESPLRILSITADTLTARFELPELQINTPSLSAEGDSADLGTEIHFEGADQTLDVGRPRLPVYAQCIGIPIAGTPIATVIQARPEVRSVENVRVTPDDPIFPTAVSTSRRNSQGFYPSKLVEIIPSGFVRDQRIASLQINPVQYNSRTKQLRIFTSVTFRINFPYSPVAGEGLTRHLLVTRFPLGKNLFKVPVLFLRACSGIHCETTNRRNHGGVSDGCPIARHMGTAFLGHQH